MVAVLDYGTDAWRQMIALGAVALEAQCELGRYIRDNTSPIHPECLVAFAGSFAALVSGGAAEQFGLTALLQDSLYNTWEEVVAICSTHIGDLTPEHVQAAEQFCTLVIKHICQIA